MKMTTINDLNLAGKRCLIRLDLNAPLDPLNFRILNDERLKRAVPTINFFREQRARIVLTSHLGRPNGKRVPEYSMAVVRERLSEILKTDVIDAGGPAGQMTEKIVGELKNGEVALLENLRFEAGEKTGDSEFAASLAGLGDLYVNDAFAVAHRSHASLTVLPTLLPSLIGPSFELEIDTISKALQSPAKPAVALFGGAKIADKIQQLTNVAKSFDELLLGGGLAAPFLKLRGLSTGGFKISDEDVEQAERLTKIEQCTVNIPVDFVTTKSFDENAPYRVIAQNEIEHDDLIMDIGPKTTKRYAEIIGSAKTLVWNGPVGYYEWGKYQAGTVALAEKISKLRDAITVAGGGSTVSVIADTKIDDKLTHVSTGGGAFLKMLANEPLVAYQILKQTGAMSWPSR